MSYRSAPETAPPSRLVHDDTRKLAYVALAMGIVGGIIGVFSLRDVDLRCSRAAATCAIETKWPFTAERSQIIPLARIHGVRVDGSRKSSQLVLVTDDGDVPISSSLSSESRLLPLRDRVQDFLDDPASNDVFVSYNEGSLLPLLFALVILVGAFFASGRIAILIDPSRDSFQLRRERWIGAKTIMKAPLSSVIDIEIESKDGSKGRTHRLVVVETGGARTPLGSSWSYDYTRTRRLADDLRALCPAIAQNA